MNKCMYSVNNHDFNIDHNNSDYFAIEQPIINPIVHMVWADMLQNGTFF